MESKWNTEISDIYAEVNITKDDVFVDYFKTPSIYLAPWTQAELSGFFNAIQSFSNLYLGQPINEINTKDWKIIFSHAKSILCAVKIPMDIYEHCFTGLHINRIISLLESIVRLINDFHMKIDGKENLTNNFDPKVKEKINLLFSNARQAF